MERIAYYFYLVHANKDGSTSLYIRQNLGRRGYGWVPSFTMKNLKKAVMTYDYKIAKKMKANIPACQIATKEELSLMMAEEKLRAL